MMKLLLQIGSNDEWFLSDSVKREYTQMAYCCIDKSPFASRQDAQAITVQVSNAVHRITHPFVGPRFSPLTM